MMGTFEQVREAYVKRYPFLDNITKGPTWKRDFARAALRLVASDGVSVADLWELAKVAENMKPN